MDVAPVLIAGRWRAAQAARTFQAENPSIGERCGEHFPVSGWADCDEALAAAAEAAGQLATLPAERIAAFLDDFAARIEAGRAAIVALAHQETALPVKPRLDDVELPRTTGQLRQAAAAAREGSWALPTIDAQANIRSMLLPIGPVAVFGPNNFPLAFNSVSGGDFAAAIAAGNPVIAKANTSHPGTTKLLAEAALAAVQAAELPAATVQLIYRTSHADGERLVADPRLGATGYTGSRSAGLALKQAADAAGKPIYLELSSINPVVVLPGAIRQRGEQLAEEFTTSCLMGTGQFCTNPGLVLLLDGDDSRRWIGGLVERFGAANAGTLLSSRVATSLVESIGKLQAAGAELLVGGGRAPGPRASVNNTLLRTTAKKFIAHAEALQTEAFGNASLVVVADSADELAQVLDSLEGNLTGSIYSDTAGGDDALYAALEPHLRRRVGRLLNDKMPTGVAVSPAMNHGGPYPATGHPGFTAVGIPASLRRFAMLACYDNVRPSRLPAALRDKNPSGRLWRLIDGVWTTAGVGASS
ncbi:MAG: aldehyde dehydrogenase (NADP(+)) [Pirellulales bacterium]